MVGVDNAQINFMEGRFPSHNAFAWSLYRNYLTNWFRYFCLRRTKNSRPRYACNRCGLFFTKHNLADVTVSSNYGINSTDRATIQNLPEIKQATFGYLQDVKVKNKQDVLRVFSQSNNLSSYELRAISQKTIKKLLFLIC